MRRALLGLVGVVGALLLIGGITTLVLSEPRPETAAGPEAEALAQAMQGAVNAEAWAQTGAVAWTFAGRNQHLWDRTRHWARVRWGDTEAQVDLNTLQGQAWRDGQPLDGWRKERAVSKAYSSWVNDSFWLNAVTKAFDPGTERALVPGAPGQLVVAYTSGGLTPGDLYLWELDAQSRPVAWRMWVSIIPIGGARATWEGWTQLPTGAWVATRHSLGPITVDITDLRAATTLAELESPDPFAPLVSP